MSNLTCYIGINIVSGIPALPDRPLEIILFIKITFMRYENFPDFWNCEALMNYFYEHLRTVFLECYRESQRTKLTQNCTDT